METLVGLMILALDIYAIVRILDSSATTAAKVGWSLLVILLPVIGLLIWALAGPDGRAKAGI